MYKDIITISTVSFHAEWGDKERNINRITGYMEAAAKKGSDLIVFPEMALTSYDDEPDVPVDQKMQHKLAETVPGPTSNVICELAKKLGLYVILGMTLARPPLPFRECSALLEAPETKQVCDGSQRRRDFHFLYQA